ncbi:hypothetical protein ACFLVC_00865 [Chloroflexota bacterium]
MRRIFKVLGLAMVITAILVVALAGTALAAGYGYMEPAPESGDGIPNGSGFDREVGLGPGPAPNSGDGVSDGSGF